jgi:hypothetical protein
VTLIVGIDPSAKKIALVAKETVLNVQHAEAYPLYVRGQTKQTAESIHRAMEAVNDFLDHIEGLIGDAPRHAFIETPVIGRGGATTAMKQAYVGGVIRACLVERGFTVHEVNQSTWKAFLGANTRVGAKGRQTEHQKANVARAVKVRWPKVQGLIAGDGDLTDAAGICLYGEGQVASASVPADASRPTGSGVQGRGRAAVVRSSRVRRPVRRPAGMHGGQE